MTERQAPYSASTPEVKITYVEGDTIREFFVVLRRALLMIVRWIEKTYPDSVA